MSKISQEEIDQEVVKFVLGTKKHFKNLRQRAGYEDEWLASENVYFNGSANKYTPDNEAHTGFLHHSVEVVPPKMDKVIFPPDGDFIGATPDEADKDNAVKQQEAEAASILLKDQFIDSNARTKLIPAYRDLSIYGTVFLKTRWRHETKERFKRVDGAREKVWEVVYDNPDFDVVPIWDIFADPKDENLEGAIIQQIDVDYYKLLNSKKEDENGEMVAVYRNVEKLKEHPVVRELDTEKQESDENRNLARHEYGPHEKKIRVNEYFGPVPKWFLTGLESDRQSEDMVENAFLAVAETAKDAGEVLLVQDNPFDHNEKPFLVGRYIKVNGRLYGIGVISRVSIPIELEYNKLRSLSMRNREFMLKPKWIKDRNGNISNKQLVDEENVILETDDINALRPIVPPDFTASSIASGGQLENSLQNVTGAKPLLSGTPVGSSLERTASAVATVVSGGLERFELVVTQFEEDILKGLARHYWALSQQFMQEGIELNVAGKGLVRVFPQEIATPKINFIGIKELGEKEFKVSTMNILLQNIIPFAQFGLDPIPLLLKLVRLLGFGDLIAEIDKRPESQLEHTPEGETQLLMSGQKVRVDMNENHDAFIQAYTALLQQTDIPDNVRNNTLEALGQRLLAKQALSLVTLPKSDTGARIL